MKLFNVSIKYKRNTTTDIQCRSGCKEYLSTVVFPQLLNTVKRIRGASYTRAKVPLPTQEYFQELVIKHFILGKNYMFCLNADPNLYKGFHHESSKKQYKVYLHIIHKAMRGQPYKKTPYQVYPEYGDKNGKFHVNLIINLEYYPDAKNLCNDLRRLLTSEYTKYKAKSCSLPTTYGRKPNMYACKDAAYMHRLGLIPFIKKY